MRSFQWDYYQHTIKCLMTQKSHLFHNFGRCAILIFSGLVSEFLDLPNATDIATLIEKHKINLIFLERPKHIKIKKYIQDALTPLKVLILCKASCAFNAALRVKNVTKQHPGNRSARLRTQHAHWTQSQYSAAQQSTRLTTYYVQNPDENSQKHEWYTYERNWRLFIYFVQISTVGTNYTNDR